MTKIYARAGIPVYWIVNLVDRQIEVYTEPSDDGYQSRQDFASDDQVPVIIEGREVGRDRRFRPDCVNTATLAPDVDGSLAPIPCPKRPFRLICRAFSAGRNRRTRGCAQVWPSRSRRWSSRRRQMPTETLDREPACRAAALVARSPAGRAGRGGLSGLPRLGRAMGQARATRLGRGDRHGRPQSLARGPDSRASAPRETAVAALVDRRADDAHRPSRRVGRSAPRCARGHGHGGAHLHSRAAAWGAGHWDWPRPLSSVRSDSSSARCARPATTVCSRSSSPWPCTRPIAVSRRRGEPDLAIESVAGHVHR